MNFYGLPDFVSYAILVGIAVALIRQDQDIHLKYWLAGWVIVLLHAFVFMLVIPSLVADVIGRGLLALAGLAFGVAAYYQKTVLEMPRLLKQFARIGLPNLTFAIASTAYVELHPDGQAYWPFAVLIALGAICAIWQVLDGQQETKGQFLALIALTFFTSGLQAWSLYAYGVLMASQWLMCWTYLAVAFFFVRQARALTTGVTFTALSFVLWALVFPVYSLLNIYAPSLSDHIQPGVWNLPKFLTAASMILVLLEERVIRTTQLVDNLPNGAIYGLQHSPVDGYRLTYGSAGIEAITGLPAHILTRDKSAFSRIIHPDDLPGYLESVERSRTTKAVLDCQFRAYQPNGSVIWIRCRSAPRETDRGTVWDGIMMDVTRERTISQELQKAKETAEEAERAKADFLATMSHEIRTPMNAVLGMTRLVLKTQLMPKQRNYLQKIDLAANALLSIINDILDFSKIEARKLELEEADFVLDSVLDSVAAVTAMKAEEKGLEIAYAVAPDVPRNLRGDPLRLGQVLINLVGNAVKFTGAGEVVISIDLVSEQGRPKVRFAVRDTGIGLEAGQIASLFRPFSQADTQISRRYGGTGLGLAISKQLVEMMGGKIEVESEPGVGSTFRFTIEAKAASTGEANPLVGRRLLEGRRVLIVDDNESARQVLAEMIPAFGMKADTADSGAAALAILKAASDSDEPYHLVLMDWQMPGMDGLEAARRIKADASLSPMPAVLMVTAFAREEILQQVEGIGLQGVLIKPVTNSMMLDTILSALAVPGQPHLSGARQGDLNTGADPKETFRELMDRRVLVVDDNAMNREVACEFLAAVGVVVDGAASGMEALRQLEVAAYDAVLMDLHMPEMDGFATTREIRQSGRWPNLPIIALTAQARIEDQQASLAAGMVAHVTKPIDENALYRTLAGVISGSWDAAGANGTHSAHAIESDPSRPFRLPGRTPEQADRLLRGYLKDFTDGLAQFDADLQAGDIAKIAAFAHLVKGSAGYFNADALGDVAGQLEGAARHDDKPAVSRHASAFRSSLQNLVERIRVGVRNLPDQAGRGENDVGRALLLIEQVEPLIAQGNYGALELLEEIAAQIAGDSDAGLVEEVRSLYDELELPAAGAALLRLKVSLQARSGGGSS